MMLKDFIAAIINTDSVRDVLTSEQFGVVNPGWIYEALWDVIFKFGYCEKFPRSRYINLIGNFNNANLNEIHSIKNYLETNHLVSGNKSGSSDHILQHKATNKYILTTCKYFKNSQDRDISEYDIQNIVAVADEHKAIYKDYRIIALVNDKVDLLKKVARANKSSEYIAKYLNKNNIFDVNDLQVYYNNFTADIRKYQFESFDDIFTDKNNLITRFHQKMIINKTIDLIHKNYRYILWGMKTRSGKTYTTGGLIHRYQELFGRANVLIITPCPTETLTQFSQDLFYSHKEFSKFRITELSSKTITTFESESHDMPFNVVIASKQFLQKHIRKETIIQNLKALELDLIVFDENHFSGTTNISKRIVRSYKIPDTNIIFLSATYKKIILEWNIPSECCLYWDIEDEQLCKRRDAAGLIEKHGEEAALFMSNKAVLEIYDIYPDLHIITNMFDMTRYTEIKERIQDTSYGFSFNTLFALSDNKKRFLYDQEIALYLRYISGSHKECDFPNGDKSIFSRIRSIIRSHDSRECFTQLWFLPMNNIDEISQCLKSLITKDTILNKYDVLIINSKRRYMQSVKNEIIKAQIVAKESNKTGLIILSGGMLSLGITLKKCDIVMLMNNTISGDRIFQMMGRCMSETANGSKKIGFVVDMNVSRVINTCISYNVRKNITLEEKIKYIINYHLINIDVDYFDNNHIDERKSLPIINKILEIWRKDPIQSINSLLRGIENDIIELDFDEQKYLNKYFTNSIESDKINAKIQFSDVDQQLQDGVKKESVSLNADADVDSKDEVVGLEEDKDVEETEEYVEILIEFSKEILPFIIPLCCILNMENTSHDFMNMIRYIKNDSRLLNVFNEQTYIWWNNKDVIGFIEKIVDKYVYKNANVYNICITIKLTLKSMLDDKIKLLEYIHSCLKPKTIEKKKFGEVFTPIWVIEEMFDKIQECDVNCFANPNSTWLDPAVGIGNFAILLYYRLMDGLKQEIEDEGARKKHILENMIYLSELNKKNCFLVKQIFNPDNEYNINLHQGDSLKLNIADEWNVDQFTYIIGNPPYNEELTKTGAVPLYNKFIEKFLSLCDRMSFIVPSRWFAGGKGLGKFRKLMLNRTDIVYINHFSDSKQIFDHIDIKGGVNYFLIDKQHNGLCSYNNIMIKLNTYDILVEAKYYNLIERVRNLGNLEKLYRGRYFDIETNDKRLQDACSENRIKCYVSKQKGFVKYIDKSQVKKDITKWKVLVTDGAHKENSGFGNIFIARPDEVHSGSYVSFEVEDEKEAQSLDSYLKCKLSNLLLSIRKISQHTNMNTCLWIPLVPLDRLWSDASLFEYLHFEQEIIDLVSIEIVIGYKEQLPLQAHEEVKTEEKKEEHGVELAKQTVTDLKKLCKSKGLKGYNKLKKADLLKLLE